MRLRPAFALVCLGLAALAGPCYGQEAPDTPARLATLSLEDLMDVKVSVAALHAQSMAEAPANVTVITQDDIRGFGYRSLGEVLSYVRGFFVSGDRTYEYAGVRGFNIPGDYGRRFLVLIDGHNMTTTVDNATYAFGQDFPLDLSLIRQIEIIRGPSSALYGSNGILATINIVTFKAADVPRLYTRAEFASAGERKLEFSTVAGRNDGPRVLLSASVFNNTGEQTIPVEHGNPGMKQNLRLENVDGEKGYHLFARFDWKRWSVMALVGSRSKVQPVSWGDTVLGDKGTRAADGRGFIEARYERPVGDRTTLTWRVYYDSSRYLGVYHFPAEEQTERDNREYYWGDWLGTQVVANRENGRWGTTTLGVEGRVELRARILIEDVTPTFHPWMDINKPDHTGAVFLQHAIPLGRVWVLHTGARIDRSAHFGTVVSPRVAFVHQAGKSTTLKFIYGQAFRNPSAFETYEDDGGVSMAPNPGLRPERSRSVEAVVARKLGGFRLLASVFRTSLTSMITPTYTATDAIRQVNAEEYRTMGVEAGASGVIAGFLDLRATFNWQRAVDQDTGNWLTNAPLRHGSVLVRLPVLNGRLTVGGGARYFSSRLTQAGDTLPRVILGDITLSTHRLTTHFDLMAGIRNAFNRRYSHPISLDDEVDSLRARGRTCFLTLVWHSASR